ncbi:u3 small nucleolar ribonucleoprotein MPP10 [Chamberlinius hualienensis]
MAVEVNVYDKVLEDLNQFDLLLSNPTELAESLKTSTKELYDYVKSVELPTCSKSNSLPELIINKFNDEQIWQQLVLQNNSCQALLYSNVITIRKALENNNQISLVCSSVTRNEADEEISDDEEIEDDVDYDEDDDMDEDVNEEDDYVDALDNPENFSGDKFLDDDEMSDTSIELEKALDEEIARDKGMRMSDEEDDDSDDNDGEVENDENQLKGKNASKKPLRSSVVDDKFFKLSQLEDYLNTEDVKESIRQKRESINSKRDIEDDDDMIEMFCDIPSDDEHIDDDVAVKKKLSCRQLKYADFFDSPEDGEKHKKVAFNLPDSTGAEDDSNNEEESDDEGMDMQSKLKKLAGMEVKSSFEIRQEKIKSRIKELEDGSLSEKPWQLIGEAAANVRPQNSLLHENLQFDHMTRPPPIITVELTQKLENLVKQRIKDHAFDDVERKIKPTKDPYDYRKNVVLDQEKSKLSLAEVYAQEYLKQQSGKVDEQEEPKENLEIKKEMKLLFDRLSALTEYRDVPKQPLPEMKIVSNLPAIVVEEVTPVGVTDATLLAPEEIKNKLNEELRGSTERNSTDKLRARRKKKLKIKHKIKVAGQRLPKLKPENKESSDKNNKNSKLTSSKDFFAKLQEVQKSTSSKALTVKSKKQITSFSASKLKL